MSNKTIEFKYLSYPSSKDIEPTNVQYTIPISEEVTFSDMLKHFRRFLKALDIS
jgi:hypothetical protein